MAMHSLATVLGHPVETLWDVMPYREFIGWILYYEQRERRSVRVREGSQHNVVKDWDEMSREDVQSAFGAVSG